MDETLDADIRRRTLESWHRLIRLKDQLVARQLSRAEPAAALSPTTSLTPVPPASPSPTT